MIHHSNWLRFAWLVLLLLVGLVPGVAAQPVFFQAHRGAVDEAPENTLAALRHAWQIPGAVPEVDVRTTRDGVLIVVHDDTLGRTTDAPAPFSSRPIRELTLAEIQRWDAGQWFDARFAGERVPTLRAVFTMMQGDPERRLYLDLKAVDLTDLKALIEEHGVEDRVLFVHGSPQRLQELRTVFPEARTMTWLSGSPEQIRQRFEAMATTDFAGISQLQFHLPVADTTGGITYALPADFLAEARQRLTDAGVTFQLRPFDFDAAALRRLLDLGIHWYVADAPQRFADSLRTAQALPTR